jgi:hypothetical protein
MVKRKTPRPKVKKPKKPKKAKKAKKAKKPKKAIVKLMVKDVKKLRSAYAKGKKKKFQAAFGRLSAAMIDIDPMGDK